MMHLVGLLVCIARTMQFAWGERWCRGVDLGSTCGAQICTRVGVVWKVVGRRRSLATLRLGLLCALSCAVRIDCCALGEGGVARELPSRVTTNTVLVGKCVESTLGAARCLVPIHACWAGRLWVRRSRRPSLLQHLSRRRCCRARELAKRWNLKNVDYSPQFRGGAAALATRVLRSMARSRRRRLLPPPRAPGQTCAAARAVDAPSAACTPLRLAASGPHASAQARRVLSVASP